MNRIVRASLLAIAAITVSLSGASRAESTSSVLTCADFNPTQEALERFPDLKGACEGIVERDGELYAKITAYVQRVARAGNAVWLHLPATDHTFKVTPGPDARVLTGSTKMRPGDLIRGQDVHIYLAVSEFGKPNIESIAFTTEQDLILDFATEALLGQIQGTSFSFGAVSPVGSRVAAWDPLRDHPRFQALLEEYEVEQ